LETVTLLIELVYCSMAVPVGESPGSLDLVASSAWPPI
jgi:hypothetical protein